MRWATFSFSAALLGLSFLGTTAASPLQEARSGHQYEVPPRVLSPGPSTRYEWVFRGDSRHPDDLRRAGGFQPVGEGWDDYHGSFLLDRHYEGGAGGGGRDDQSIPWRTAYVSMTVAERTAETYGEGEGEGWIYQIRATPHILDDNDAEAEVLALGGVQWRQVWRYRRNVHGSPWIENPEFDRNAFDNPANRDLYHLTPINGMYTDRNQDIEWDELRSVDEDEADDNNLINVMTDWMYGQERLMALYNNRWPFDFPAVQIPIPHQDDLLHYLNMDLATLQQNGPPDMLRVVQQALGLAPAAGCSSGLPGHWGKRQVTPEPNKGPGSKKCRELYRIIRRALKGAGQPKSPAKPDKKPTKPAKKPTTKPKPAKDATKSPCKSIRDLEFAITLSNDWASGTNDILGAILEGPAGKAEFEIASRPPAGFSTRIKINLKEKFGKDTIPIDGIKTIKLTSQGQFVLLDDTNDRFKVQDIALHAKCAEPGYDLTDNKYLALNTFYQYPDASWVPLVGHDKKVAATLPVDVNDWAPVCYTIKDLSYFFQLGTGWFGGAEGTLWFALGGHKRFKLGTDLSRGDWKDGHIPLKEYFGQDQVDLRRLNKFELFDTGARDNFDFKGIHFEAKCADSNKKIVLKKFDTVDKTVGQDTSKEVVYNGDIANSDWMFGGTY